MRAEELRIGNYYQADIDFPKGSLSARLGFGGDRIFILDERINQVIWASYSNIELWRFIRPIQLTEEWLLKFGFEKLSIGDGNEYILMINGFGVSVNLLSGSVGLDYLEHKDIAKINNVHQLQNLYFALTGQELEIKS